MKHRMFVFAAVLTIIMAMSGQAYANPYLAVVTGHVYDSTSGNPISGAEIIVSCLSNTETETATTGSDGVYNAVLVCPEGSSVEVEATYGDGSATETGLLAYIGTVPVGTAFVDVSIATVDVLMPEFPVGFLPAMMTVLGVGLVRRKF